MLRTLGGKNIGKCRLRAHQHPLLPPLSNLRRACPHAKQPRQDASSTRDERVLGDVLKIGCFLHRFLISGPDLRITARFSPETHSNVQRFRISGGQFGNRCKVMPVYDLQRAAILDFGPRLKNHCKIFPRNTLQHAAILNFRGQTWQSL